MNFDFVDIYRKSYLIRRVEEKIITIYHTDKIKSPVHLSIGQELASVSVCSNLTNADKVVGTYRGHALYLAKGGDPYAMVAELYGKKDGCSGGKGGSMHLADSNVGMTGTSAIVASGISNALGYAFSQFYRGSLGEITVVFFGDGATEEGVFYECLNFAALHRLPILFVCENNFYAINSRQKNRVAKANYVDKAQAFGVPGRKVSYSLQELLSEARNAVDYVRSGKGPFFLEIETYRWMEHVGVRDDTTLGARDTSELKYWIKNDLLISLREKLSQIQIEEINRQVNFYVEHIFELADNAPFPRDEDLYSDCNVGE